MGRSWGHCPEFDWNCIVSRLSENWWLSRIGIFCGAHGDLIYFLSGGENCLWPCLGPVTSLWEELPVPFLWPMDCLVTSYILLILANFPWILPSLSLVFKYTSITSIVLFLAFAMFGVRFAFAFLKLLIWDFYCFFMNLKLFIFKCFQLRVDFLFYSSSFLLCLSFLGFSNLILFGLI